MELVKLLRELWRRRLLVGLVAGLSAGVGIVVAVKPSELPSRLDGRSYRVGIATARILVDTPRSQVVVVTPAGSDTLGTRASLLASLMTDGTLAASIAHRAGLRAAELAARSQSGPAPPPGLPDRGRDARELRTRVVTNGVGDQLPIIEVEAQAPGAREAAALAKAAVAGLRAFLDSKAAEQRVPEARRLRVSALGSPAVSEAQRGPTPELAALVGVGAFLAGCALILLAGAFARGWRQAAHAEGGTGPVGEDAGDAGWPAAAEDADTAPGAAGHEVGGAADDASATSAPDDLDDPDLAPEDGDDDEPAPGSHADDWAAADGRAATVRRMDVGQPPALPAASPPPVRVAVQQVRAVLGQALRRTLAR
jgi:hypothetical protein